MQPKLSFSLFLALAAAPAAAQVPFDPASSHPVGPQPEGVTFGDFDGNGTMDLAATADAPDRVSICFGNGDGTFGAAVAVFTGAGTSPHTPVAGDLDGDSDVDIAVTLKNTNQVRVLLNNGAGGFSLGSTTSVGQEPRSMAIGNLGGSSALDLVCSNRNDNTLTVLTNAGNATFSTMTLAAGNDPREVTIGELTGDLLMDIAVSAHDDASVRVFANTGGGFSVLADLPLGLNRKPQGIDAGDIDGNGTTDIVTSSNNNAIEYVSVFSNNGGSFAGPVHTIIAGQDASSLTLGDFDLDGDQDAATANTDSNDVSVLENVGGSLTNEIRYAVGGEPGQVVAADVDGNASPDLATPNNLTNNVSILRSQAGCGVMGTFCTAKAGLACGTPSISSSGTPSASAASGFTISAAPARAGRTGVLLYNTGPESPAVAFQGGLLCVQASGIRRGGPASSGGSATCDGVFAMDMNTFAAGQWPQPAYNPAPFLREIGQRVSVQWWGRDTVATGSFLSDAMEYSVCP